MITLSVNFHLSYPELEAKCAARVAQEIQAHAQNPHSSTPFLLVKRIQKSVDINVTMSLSFRRWVLLMAATSYRLNTLESEVSYHKTKRNRVGIPTSTNHEHLHPNNLFARTEILPRTEHKATCISSKLSGSASSQRSGRYISASAPQIRGCLPIPTYFAQLLFPEESNTREWCLPHPGPAC